MKDASLNFWVSILGLYQQPSSVRVAPGPRGEEEEEEVQEEEVRGERVRIGGDERGRNDSLWRLRGREKVHFGGSG